MSFLDKFKFAKKPFKTTEKADGSPLGRAENIEVIEKKPRTAKTAKLKNEKTEKQKNEKTKVEKLKVRKEDTKDAHRVLVRPIISEKAADLSADGQYVFEVFPQATKPEIRKAVRNVYGVMPIKVRIINSAGKEVRFGRNIGKLRNKKKAIVTLKKGDKIEIYEGV